MAGMPGPSAELRLRGNLVATQVVGLMLVRYVIRLEPLASADPEDVVRLVAPTLQRYLTDIRRIPVLSREEEHRLALRWHEQGDREAAWQLVTANLRLVVMIAREYQRAFHNLLDLVQEGSVGLLEAVKNFDPYRGIRFPSYAVWWIRAYIIRYIINNWRLVKVGRGCPWRPRRTRSSGRGSRHRWCTGASGRRGPGRP